MRSIPTIGLTLFMICAHLLQGTAAVEAGNTVYCHVSMLEGEVYLIQPGRREAIQPTVNHPLIPGDVLYTNSTGRCEIQFGNGTIMRLDRHTDLRLDTLLAPGLTTRKKISTLLLNKGTVFAMTQVYRQEIFQIVTPATAIRIDHRSKNTVRVEDSGRTHVVVERGRVAVLLDRDQQLPRRRFIKAGEGYRIDPGGQLEWDHEGQNRYFIAWNETINRNFKQTHEGISFVPQAIQRYSPGIIAFAERFSTRYGRWIYSALFGYVWQPADPTFTAHRPFFDANYVEVNGELFLVPNQPWGWAPAHLGTWFWSTDDGWLWIPGNAFSRGICSIGLKRYPHDWMWETLSPFFWIEQVYGSFPLYKIYRRDGAASWRHHYVRSLGTPPANDKPTLDDVPENIRDILERMNQASLQIVCRDIESYRLPESLTSKPMNLPSQILNHRPVKNPAVLARIKSLKGIPDRLMSHRRDWNPDARWSKALGVPLYYSSRKNAVVSTQLDIDSRNITAWEQRDLHRARLSGTFDRSLSRRKGPVGTSTGTGLSSAANAGSSTRPIPHGPGPSSTARGHSGSGNTAKRK